MKLIQKYNCYYEQQYSIIFSGKNGLQGTMNVFLLYVCVSIQFTQCYKRSEQLDVDLLNFYQLYQIFIRFIKFLLDFSVCLFSRVHTHTHPPKPLCIYGSQKITRESQFSPSSIQVLGLELSLGSQQLHQLIHLAALDVF